jgi:hypothetical protein
MGSWGPKLYQDDVAQDIRDQYKDLLKRGKTSEDITNLLIKEYGEMIDDIDDGPIFWFVLADVQWECGRLLESVKEMAIQWIEKGTDQQRWIDENPKEAKIRVKVLDELKEKLKSQQPTEKKVSQHKIYKCEWEIGDVFAYRIESDYAKQKGLAGRYLLIRKVDECTWWPGHIVPIVYVSITNGNDLPQSSDEIQQSQYIQSTFARRKKEFRILLLSTSKRIIPMKRLQFIGNFPDLISPRDEYIIYDKVSTSTCSWSKFEESLIDRYYLYGANHGM